MALAIERGTDYWAEMDVAANVEAKFRNPARPSLVSQADAMCKIVQSFPWIAESDVALEELGFSDDQIMRLRSDRKAAQSRAVVMEAALRSFGQASAPLAAGASPVVADD